MRPLRSPSNPRPTLDYSGSPPAADELAWDRARDAKVKERSCLRCGKSFPSAGPGNRMCGGCRNGAQDASPYAPETDPDMSVADLTFFGV